MKEYEEINRMLPTRRTHCKKGTYEQIYYASFILFLISFIVYLPMNLKIIHEVAFMLRSSFTKVPLEAVKLLQSRVKKKIKIR